MAIFPGYGTGAELVRSYPVANGISSVEEGLAMIFKLPLEDGIAKVAVGSADANDVFAGVSFYQYRVLPTKLNAIEEITVPANGIFTLAKTPFAPATEVRVVLTAKGGTKTVLTYEAEDPADETQFNVLGSVITVDVKHEGLKVTVTYSYAPSAAEARNFYGDVRPGVSNTSSMGVINVIQKGVIVTTNFDPASDWADATPVKANAAGFFTKAGAAVTIPNCIVKEVPSASKPFLTLELR